MFQDKTRIFRRIAALPHELRLFCNTSPAEMTALGVRGLELRVKLQTRGQSGKNNFVGFIYDKPAATEMTTTTEVKVEAGANELATLATSGAAVAASTSAADVKTEQA